MSVPRPAPRPLAAQLSLAGRRAVVTGAAGLLGREFAGALAEQGAAVALVDLDGDGAAAVAAGLAPPAEGAHEVLVGDLADEGWVVDAIAGLAATGSVDVLVNSAALDPKMGVEGEAHPGFLDHPTEAWQRSLEINLTGLFRITREVCRVMEGQGPRGRGAIVNLASTYGLVGPDQRLYHRPGRPPGAKPLDYPTTKAGVVGFSRALAAWYRDTEIRVNALAPGGAFAGHDEGFADAYAARTIVGRMAEPHEYRGPIAFLCSDASSYMTGATLVVDGGWTAL